MARWPCMQNQRFEGSAKHIVSAMIELMKTTQSDVEVRRLLSDLSDAELLRWSECEATPPQLRSVAVEVMLERLEDLRYSCCPEGDGRFSDNDSRMPVGGRRGEWPVKISHVGVRSHVW
jgi:hypothetical protein